jgi:hypothetical protein
MDYSTLKHLESGIKICLIQKGEKKELQVDQYFCIKGLVYTLNLQTLGARFQALA